MNPGTMKLEMVAFTPRWWALVLRGLAAIAFGVLALVVPAGGLLALVYAWGAYAIADGALAVGLSVRGARVLPGWGWLLAQGLVGIAAGVVTFVWPGITALVLLGVIAAWAVLTGVAELATAIRLRRVLHGEWLLAASGVLSIAFGAMLVAKPGAGALAVTWMIGSYAALFGVLLVALGLRLRRFTAMAHPSRPASAPSHA